MLFSTLSPYNGNGRLFGITPLKSQSAFGYSILFGFDRECKDDRTYSEHIKNITTPDICIFWFKADGPATWRHLNNRNDVRDPLWTGCECLTFRTSFLLHLLMDSCHLFHHLHPSLPPPLLHDACVVGHSRLFWKEPRSPPLLLVDIKASIYMMRQSLLCSTKLYRGEYGYKRMHSILIA